MQPSAAASFFPTATELSSGVQWFKDHPVLAAAAATAVSVITYLNTLQVADPDVPLVNEDVAAHPTATASSFSTRQKRLALVRRTGAVGSDGSKLSAAVSWCDEHGGSLTQVFEDDTPSSVVACLERRLEAGDRDSESDGQDDAAVALVEGRHKGGTTQLVDAGTAVTNESDVDAEQTESPQWGWYVPITPPQDQFHPGAERNVQERAPSPLVKQSTSADVRAMRRTTSGHLS
uniref:Uncharacterized protein n=1 Tax=Peronospora matthiolae TaxID=2874970 RepID=A0AAV1TNJ4_9STRA